MLLPIFALLLPTAIISINTDDADADGVCDLKSCSVADALDAIDDVPFNEDIELRFDFDVPSKLVLDRLALVRGGAVRLAGKRNLQLVLADGLQISTPRDIELVGIVVTSPDTCMSLSSGGDISIASSTIGLPGEPCGHAAQMSGNGNLQIDNVDVATRGEGLLGVNVFATVALSELRIEQPDEQSGGSGLQLRGDVIDLDTVSLAGAWTSGDGVVLTSTTSEGAVTIRGLTLSAPPIRTGERALARATGARSTFGVHVTAQQTDIDGVTIDGYRSDVALEVNDINGFQQRDTVTLSNVRIGVGSEGEAGGIGTGIRVSDTLSIQASDVVVTGCDDGLVVNALNFGPSLDEVRLERVVLGGGGNFGNTNRGLFIPLTEQVLLNDVVVAGNSVGLEVSAVDLVIDGLDIDGNVAGGTLRAQSTSSADDVVVINNSGSGLVLEAAAVDLDLEIGVDRDGAVVGNGGAGLTLRGGGLSGGGVRNPSPHVFAGRVVGSAGVGIVSETSQIDGASVSGNGVGVLASGSQLRNMRIEGSDGVGVVCTDDTVVSDSVIVDNDGGGVRAEGGCTLQNVDVGLDEGALAPNGGEPAVVLVSFEGLQIDGGRYRAAVDAEAVIAARFGSLSTSNGAELNGTVIGEGPEVVVAVGVAGDALRRGVFAAGGGSVDLSGASVCGAAVGVTVLSGSFVTIGDVGVRDGVVCNVGSGVVGLDPAQDDGGSIGIAIAGTVTATAGAAIAIEDFAGFVQIDLDDAVLNGSAGGLVVRNVGLASLEGNVAGSGALSFRGVDFEQFNLRFDLADVVGDAVSLADGELPAFAIVSGVVDGVAGRGVVLADVRLRDSDDFTVFNVDVEVHGATETGVDLGVFSDDSDDELSLLAIAVDGGGDGVVVRTDMAAVAVEGLASNNQGDGLVLDAVGFVDLNGFFSGARLTPLFGRDVPDTIAPRGNRGHGVRCTGETSTQLIGVSSGNNGGAGVLVEQGCTVTGLAGSQLGGVGNTRAGNAGGGLVVIEDGAVHVGDVDLSQDEDDLDGLLGSLGDALNCFIQHNGTGGVIVRDRGTVAPGPLLVVSDNVGLDVDMNADGRTLNDVGDLDGVLNAPVITNVVLDVIEVTISGFVGAGETVHLYRSKSRAGDGEPFDHIASFVEGGVDDEADGSGDYDIAGVGSDTGVARFTFRLPTGAIPAVAIASDGTRSSEASSIFFLDPCLPSTLADGCDLDRDGLTNGDERAIGSNIFLADSDGDGLSDEQEGDADADDDGLIDALESNSTDADGDGLVDASDVDADSACVPDDRAGRCDRDGDGLSNADEARYGTDADSADTDGDGIPDGFEASLDSDDDGLSNGVESNVTDVDNDGLADQRDPVELAPECLAEGAVLRETVVLDTDDDVIAFNDSGVVCIVGNLLVGDAVTRLVLDALVIVTGRIVVGSSDVETVELTVLTRAGSFEVDDNDVLVSASLPAINTIDGDLQVSDNARLSILDIRALRRVGGSVIITNNGALGSVSAPDLEEIGGDLDISGNPELDTIELSDLESVDGSVNISENPDLEDLSLPGLVSVGGDLTITDNPQLTTIDAGNLTSVGGDLEISGNDDVTAIDLGGLTSVGGDLTITDDADVDLGSLEDVGGAVIVVGTASLPAGWVCVDGVCGTACGDAVVRGDERCDDGDLDDGDGCSAVCVVEPGYLCAQDSAGESHCVLADGLDDAPVAAASSCSSSASAPLFGVLALVLRRRRRSM